jgi:hypothetical protein
MCGWLASKAATAYTRAGTAVAFIISELPGGRAEALFFAMAALVPTAGARLLHQHTHLRLLSAHAEPTRSIH